jgi:hypothetical protein
METGSSPVQMDWRMLMVRISLAINRTFATLIIIKKNYIFLKNNKIIKKRIKKIRGGRPP